MLIFVLTRGFDFDLGLYLVLVIFRQGFVHYLY